MRWLATTVCVISTILWWTAKNQADPQFGNHWHKRKCHSFLGQCLYPLCTKSLPLALFSGALSKSKHFFVLCAVSPVFISTVFTMQTTNLLAAKLNAHLEFSFTAVPPGLQMSFCFNIKCCLRVTAFKSSFSILFLKMQSIFLKPKKEKSMGGRGGGWGVFEMPGSQCCAKLAAENDRTGSPWPQSWSEDCASESVCDEYAPATYPAT